MKQTYVDKRFNASSLNTLSVILKIIAEYQAQGYVMTTRMLYYQLVSRAVIANTLKEYKRIASLVNDAKLAGYIDWDALHDLTRSFVRNNRWTDGAQLLRACANQYHQDQWAGQDHRVFVIVEKEALTGVLEGICHRYDMPLLAARGYPSGSVLRSFVQDDILPAVEDGQLVTILHLGDHDPSGVDMTRDLDDRIEMFSEGKVTAELVLIDRIALNMAQIKEVKPPENPAKMTDTRARGYVKAYGKKSWELDALSPTYLNALVETNVKKYIDQSEWDRVEKQIAAVKAKLTRTANGFNKRKDK